MRIGTAATGNPRFLVKAKLCIPEASQIVAPRSSTEQGLEEQTTDIAFLFRLASDGKLELYIDPDFVLTPEQANNLDKDHVAVKWEPHEEL